MSANRLSGFAPRTQSRQGVREVVRVSTPVVRVERGGCPGSLSGPNPDTTPKVGVRGVRVPELIVQQLNDWRLIESDSTAPDAAPTRAGVRGSRPLQRPAPALPLTSEDDRRRTAHHEAGHAVASHLFGGTVELVTIIPNTETMGRAWCAAPSREGVEGFRPELPIICQPSELRRSLEREIVVRLAGSAAEELAGIRAAGFYPEPPDDESAADSAEALAELSPRHRELIEATGVVSDDQRAYDLSDSLGKDEAMFHVAWLRHVARSLVYENAHLIRPLADALLDREVITGDEAIRIIQEHLAKGITR